VLHGDVQTLHSHIVDMNKLTPQIKEVIEFQRRVIVKLILKNFLSLESVVV
jgi:hypothetical protein